MNRALAVIVGVLVATAVVVWACIGLTSLGSRSEAEPTNSSAVAPAPLTRSSNPPRRRSAARKEEPYSPLRATIRATFCRKVSVTTWKSGELRGGLAVLAGWRYADRDFHGCYWMGPAGTLYAANGDAKTYSPNLPWAPVGIDYYSVTAAARYGLVEGAKRAMRTRAQATLDRAKQAISPGVGAIVVLGWPDGSDTPIEAAVDVATFEEIVKQLKIGDKLGGVALMRQGRTILVEKGTLARIIEIGGVSGAFRMRRVRIQEGPHLAKAVWVPAQTTEPRAP